MNSPLEAIQVLIDKQEIRDCLTRLARGMDRGDVELAAPGTLPPKAKYASGASPMLRKRVTRLWKSQVHSTEILLSAQNAPSLSRMRFPARLSRQSGCVRKQSQLHGGLEPREFCQARFWPLPKCYSFPTTGPAH